MSVTERLTPSGAATKVVDFTYNAANQQIARAVHLDGNSGTAPDESRYFGYDQGQIIWQFEGSSASDLSHRYLWGPAVDQILADEKLTIPGQAGIVDWALTDQLGSVRDVVRVESGQAKVVKHRAYDAFGNLRGDLNHDGNVDLEDINLLLAAINNGTTDELFDLNGDGVVDNLTDGDLDQLILYIVKTYYGDANLDGQFDSSDMTQLQNNLHRWYDPQAGRWLVGVDHGWRRASHTFVTGCREPEWQHRYRRKGIQQQGGRFRHSRRRSRA